MSNTDNELDLSAGQYVKGVPLTGNIFLATTTFKQLRMVTRDPALLQPNARRTASDADELEDEAAIHELIQRALAGNKKSNVPSYRQYIEELVAGRRVGVLPPMHLWIEEALVTPRMGQTQYALIPNGDHLLAIDGETQLSAHWTLTQSSAAPEVKELHKDFALAAIIHHGVDVTAARQYFHDLNVLAVRPNTSLGLSMDTNDPLMQIVGDVEAALDFLRGRVDKMARQLPKKSTKVLTLQALRQMVINIGRGISGVQYGAKPAPVEDLDLRELDHVAKSWLGAYFNTFGPEVSDRENYLAGAGPVLAAVGAIGHQIYLAPAADRPALQQHLIESLRHVDWKKGEHWVGIAGNFTPSGVFSVKGTKEVSYAIFNVLSDSANAGYHRIRSSMAPNDVPQPVRLEDLDQLL
jgi:DNA sulfur modification protein DndB